MRNLLLIMLISASSVWAGNSYSQNAQLKLNVKKGTLESVFSQISKQSQLEFFYNTNALDVKQKVELSREEGTLNEILSEVLGNKYAYTVKDGYVLIYENKTANAPQVDIKKIGGVVKDQDGNALPGVTVMLKGTSLGTATDVNGRFTLSVPQEGMTLVVSFVGMKNREVPLAGKLEVIIVMEEQQSDLDEVVVIGYGTTTKKDLTGSVSRFDSKVIEESTATNIAHMMQGQVAGLSILAGDGAPGSAARLEIRGVPSISGSLSPLIVVDNVPMAQDFDINELNPDDVQSVDVLKGASSAAIYGSRAAGGVIMVTTKSGKRNQKPTVSYSYDYSMTRLVSDIATLSTDEYKMLLMEAITNTARGDGYEDVTLYPTYRDVTVPGYFGEEDTPWLQLCMRNGTKQQHKVSIRGGGENVGYYASFGYTDELGQMKATGFKRWTYDAGFDADVNKWIKASVKVSGMTGKQESNGSSLSGTASTRPDIKAYNDDGSLYLHPYQVSGQTKYIPNPIIEMTENTTQRNTDNLRMTGKVEVQVLPELNLLGQYTFQRRRGEDDSYKSSRTQAGSNYWGGQKGEGTQARSKGESSEFEGRLTYNKVFSEKHSLNAIGAVVYTKERNTSNQFKLINFSDDDVQNGIWQGTELSNLWGSKVGSATGSVMLSFLARAEYKFMNRYLLTGTIRSDGSSRFAPEYRWGTFPAVAAAWIVSEEEFLRDNHWLTFFKIRGGWGKTGNAMVGEYGWRTLYESTDNEGKPATVPMQVGNDKLKWEATSQLDLGFDFGFLPNQRVRGSLGFYKKSTDGLLYPFSMALSTGLSTTDVNFASIENKGVEFEISADIIQKKDWNWTFGFNIGKNKNKITGIDANFVSQPGGMWLSNTVIQEGKSMGLIYGFETDGIFQTWDEVNYYESLNPDHQYQELYSYRKTMPGDLKFVDQTNDGYVNKTWGNYEDKKVLGCSRPKFEGGLNTRLSWKGLTLSMQGTFSYGAQKAWSGEANMFNFSTNSNSMKTALKRWTPQNPSNKYPSVRYNFYYNDFTDASVYDASYLKIQNVNLEYRLPENIVRKARIFGNITVFASANNVYTFTSYPGPSPESWVSDAIQGASVDSDVYPTTRTFNFGVKVTIK